MERMSKWDNKGAVQRRFNSPARVSEAATRIGDSPTMAAQRKRLQGMFGGAIQRQAGEDEALQGKFAAVQRVEDEEPLQGKFDAVQRVEDEEPVQGKFETAQRVEEEEPLQGKFEAASSTQLKEEAAAKSNNTGLPDNLKSGIESLSGMSMDNVRVHYNSSQPAQLNALAYAQGTNIHVAPGQEGHLPHEAWHVVQQAQGRVKPTMQMKEGVPVNDDKSLEHEADVMGGRALSVGVVQRQSIESALTDPRYTGKNGGILQRLAVFSGKKPPEDSNIVATLPDMERQVSGPVQHHSDNPDYKSHNHIGLLAHGSPGSIEWKGESWNGARLVDDELLQSNREIQPGSLLEIWSCSAGEEQSVGANDSLVDAVRNQLGAKNVNNITVKGTKGVHLVLNDKGDHYVPKDTTPLNEIITIFRKLRTYYLWLWGFLSSDIVMAKMGGFAQETVGTREGTHPVLYPKNLDAADKLVTNLGSLYEQEKLCGGIDGSLSYKDYLQQRMASWQKMCAFLRTNSAFQAITKRVDADWYEVKS